LDVILDAVEDRVWLIRVDVDLEMNSWDMIIFTLIWDYAVILYCMLLAK